MVFVTFIISNCVFSSNKDKPYIPNKKIQRIISFGLDMILQFLFTLVILKDMELPILEEVSEEQMIDLLAEATAYPTYRYGYQRILVYEHAGEVAGIAVGYPAEDEKIIDEPLREVFKKHGLAEDVRLFIEEETLPNEWYLDTISVDERFRGMGIGSKLLDALPEVAKASGKHTTRASSWC